MTDDTGLLEHSLGRIPRRQEGYTTDDNARALWLCADCSYNFAAAEGEAAAGEQLFSLIDRYLAFLLWAQREDGRFYNNFSYDRREEAEQPSDDCQGRALWACARAGVFLPDPHRSLVARHLFRRGLALVERMRFPRGQAYALAACSFLLHQAHLSSEKEEDFFAWVKGTLPTYVEKLEERLLRLYRQNRGGDWHWFEPAVTYGNGVLPWALFWAYMVTQRAETLLVARESLHFLIAAMTAPEGWIRPIGNRGWYTREKRSLWDQQPLEVMKLALASAQAYAVCGESFYREVMGKCREWFYGANDLHEPLADPAEGSCCDGLTPTGVNRNQGAESTLSYLLTEVITSPKGQRGSCPFPMSGQLPEVQIRVTPFASSGD